MKNLFLQALAVAVLFSISADSAYAQDKAPTVLKIDAAKITAKVSPTLYGLMTEEINHAYDGGLYAEQIQNRIFKDNADSAVHWSAAGNNSNITLDHSQPVNDSLTVCLRLDAPRASQKNPAGFANDGFWGIAVKPNTIYTASFYAKAKAGFKGPVTVILKSKSGDIIYARAQVAHISNRWQKYAVKLSTGAGIKASAGNLFEISVNSPGTAWFNLVSLFPPTYHNRKNGNRPDIMQLLANLHPTFLRLPGGNYVEGSSMAHYYNWKKTIHDLSVRPGHPGTWKYRSSDGLGILEYMEWCEDLHIQPVLAVFAGYTLNKEYVPAGPGLQKFVDDALDEIEYVSGNASTKWGAQRVADGHPKPFPLHYVEIGNEDFFDRSGSYDGRFAQFYDAIKARYPNLQLIATTKVKSRTPDLLDEHFYRQPTAFENDTHHYDGYDRNTYKIFVGEWASRTGNKSPTPDLSCALGDAAWMTGLERNTDLVLMASYAPLFVNVNPGAWQWRINMIGYDALHSFGSPSYYAQQLFYQNLGNVVVSAVSDTLPQVPAPQRRQAGNTTAAAPQTMPALSFSVTKDTARGILYIKMVNISALPQPVTLQLSGAGRLNREAAIITLTGKPEDVNTVDEPKKVAPVTSRINNVANTFSYTFVPYSVTVLKLNAQK